MVWLGEPEPVEAVDQGGEEGEAASGKQPDVFASSDDQRDDRGAEHENSTDQIQCARFPQL